LKEKSEHVEWNIGSRVELFGLIAKSLDGKEKLQGEGYLCYDLEDIQRDLQEKIKNDSHRDHRGHGGKILGALGVLCGEKLYFIYN